MAFQKYNSANKAIALLDLPITESSNTLTLKGAFARFPTSNFIVTVTEFDSITGDVIFRENMLISSRSGNICNIITREFEPIPQTDDATTSIQESFAFSTDSVVEVVNSSAFNKDIQDEVERLETAKLNKGALRTALANTWRMFFSNGGNNETELAFGASGRVLQSNGATSAPSWEVPSVDVNSLSEDTTGNIANDFFVKNNGTGVNTKVKLTRYKASDAEVQTGTENTKYITAKQRRDYAPRTPGTTVTRYTLPASVGILTTNYVLLASFTTTIGGVYKLNISAFAINTGSGLDLYVDVGGVIPVTLSISAGNFGGGLYHIPAGLGDVIAVYGRRKSGTSNGTLDVFTITSD